MGLFSLSDQEARQITPPPWEVATPKRRRRPRLWHEKNAADALPIGVFRRLRVERRDVLILLAVAAVCAIVMLWHFRSNNWLDQLEAPSPSSAAIGQ